MAGPVEREFIKTWTQTLEGTPGMLEATFEGREGLTPDEVIDLLLRMIGATRDGFHLVTREIDKLHAAGG